MKALILFLLLSVGAYCQGMAQLVTIDSTSFRERSNESATTYNSKSATTHNNLTTNNNNSFTTHNSGNLVTIDSTGNFVSALASRTPSVNTGKVYTDSKGKQYPVYKTHAGKYYIVRLSKNTGNEYKYYLTVKN